MVYLRPDKHTLITERNIEITVSEVQAVRLMNEGVGRQIFISDTFDKPKL